MLTKVEIAYSLQSSRFTPDVNIFWKHCRCSQCNKACITIWSHNRPKHVESVSGQIIWTVQPDARSIRCTPSWFQSSTQPVETNILSTKCWWVWVLQQVSAAVLLLLRISLLLKKNGTWDLVFTGIIIILYDRLVHHQNEICRSVVVSYPNKKAPRKKLTKYMRKEPLQ